MNITRINHGKMANNWSHVMDELLGNSLKNNGGMTYPAVNVKENEKGFEIFVAAPGLKKDDFKISVKDKMLTISAEVMQEALTEKEAFTRKEYGLGSFSRSFKLPDFIEVDQIDAAYESGELLVTLPKKAIQNLVKEIAVK